METFCWKNKNKILGHAAGFEQAYSIDPNRHIPQIPLVQLGIPDLWDTY